MTTPPDDVGAMLAAIELVEATIGLTREVTGRDTEKAVLVTHLSDPEAIRSGLLMLCVAALLRLCGGKDEALAWLAKYRETSEADGFGLG